MSKSLDALLISIIGTFFALAIWGSLSVAQDDPNQRLSKEEKRAQREQRNKISGDEKRDAANYHQPPEVARLSKASLVWSRPTASSITASICSELGGKAKLEYGTLSGHYVSGNVLVDLKPGSPQEVELRGLKPDTRYFYRMTWPNGDGVSEPSEEHQFQTQRAIGQSFVFELQGDSHPERPQQFDAILYAQTLQMVAADKPDFYVLMGDDFSVDTLNVVNQQTVSSRYSLQRPYLALVGQTSSLYLVNGNHEQAASVNLDGTSENVAVWAQSSRNQWFPQPSPDGFYTGNTTPVPHIGLLRNYYAWSWGDALFVVIDPYWHSRSTVDNAFENGRNAGERKLKEVSRAWRDMWDITLGDEQYHWLQNTLETSKAKYKFVFAHHVLGTGRGGVEQATLFEWGGLDRRGVDGFSQHRPGWAMPIHHLMAKNGVNIFFQGHDHVFARQELDGVVYQTVPQPADPNYATHYESAYRSGVMIPSSGRLRVSVTSAKVKVEYLRSFLPKDESFEQKNGSTGYVYELTSSKK